MGSVRAVIDGIPGTGKCTVCNRWDTMKWEVYGL